MSTNSNNHELKGSELLIAGLLLAAANFLVVLDMTIANVSVPNIAGGLAVSSNEGTYVITSYAVAEAITVPLTGWLAARFGTVRVFTTGMISFGLFSMLCGLAQSLGFLVAGRILQGIAGGPLMPLSQTLLMMIFPKDKQMTAMAIWSMTTLVAPILGPIVGGYICDNWGWHWIFLINVPLAIVCSFFAWVLLKKFETPSIHKKIDVVGLLLLVLFVGSLQYMLDEGQKLDWFNSNEIKMLGLVSLIGFISFLIWESTQQDPIVDLQIFRHKGFTISVISISLTFGAFFSSIVLTPLWLQTSMGYTASWSGFVMASNGVFAVLAAPLAAKMSGTFDLRKLVTFAILWLGMVTFYRSFGSNDMTFAHIALPILFQGIAMPFFFIPLSTLALSSVKPNEVATAAGLMNFIRTLSGAFAASLTITAWTNNMTIHRNEIVGSLNNDGNLPVELLDQLVQSQSVMLATNQTFLFTSTIFIFAALVVWLAPKPNKTVDAAGAH